MKVARYHDDKRIHFSIHQRNAARISIEMTELTSMKGNLLQIVTNVNLSPCHASCLCQLPKYPSPLAPLGPQSPINKPGKNVIQWRNTQMMTKRRASKIQKKLFATHQKL